ncbi:MAG: hypothetical protein ACRCTD_00560 [Beijerinckiaceae bacterium]
MPSLQPLHYVFFGWSALVGIVCGYLSAKYPGFRDSALPPLAYIFVGIAIFEAAVMLSGRAGPGAGGAVPMPVRIAGLILSVGFLFLAPTVFG